MVSLWDAGLGQAGIVCHHNLENGDAELLRAMGLRPKARVRVCKRGEPLIVEVLSGCGHGGAGRKMGARAGSAWRDRWLAR